MVARKLSQNSSWVEHWSSAARVRLLLSASVIWLLMLLSVGSVAQAADKRLNRAVGEVVFVTGEVTLLRDGVTQPLVSGARVRVGDSLRTGDQGHVHLRMQDQGFFSLRPQGQLRLVDYHYDERKPAANRVNIQLDAGVLRSITGRAGTLNKPGYRVNTPVAAIGVRGTDFSVYTGEGLSRIAVRRGGVLMTPLGGGCLAEALGSCQGESSEELFADQLGAVLEARMGMPRALVAFGVLSPDEMSPPLPEEGLSLVDIRDRLGLRQEQEDESVADSSDIDQTDAVARRADLEGYISSQPLLQQAWELGDLEGDERAVAVGSPVDSHFVWGRWAKYAGDDPDYRRISQLMYDNRRYGALNSVFAMLETSVVDRQLPTAGRAFFRLDGYEAYIRRGDKLEPASISNAALIVDFDEQAFATRLDVNAPSLAEVVSVGGFGQLQNDGFFRSKAGSPGWVDGVLSPKAAEAGMLFEYSVSPGVDAIGATNWVNRGAD